MTLLKLGAKFYVNADEIVALQSYPSRPAQRDKAAAVEARIYKDATGTDKLRTLVHLRCGMVVGSAIGADALAKRPPIETTVRHTTRGNNLDGAQVVTGPNGNADENGGAAIVTIELPTKVARGQSFKSGAANPNAKPVVPEKAEAPAKPAAEPGLFERLLGRTDSSR